MGELGRGKICSGEDDVKGHRTRMQAASLKLEIGRQCIILHINHLKLS